MLKNISLKKSLQKYFIQFFTISSLLFSAQVSRAAKASDKLENMRIGLTYNSFAMIGNSGTAFFEYKWGIIGVRTGIELGYDRFFVKPKGKDIEEFDLEKFKKDPLVQAVFSDFSETKAAREFSSAAKKTLSPILPGEWGAYEATFISIPVIARVYPFSGDFGLFLGLKFDFLLSMKGICINNASTKDGKDLEKKINTDSNGKTKKNKSAGDYIDVVSKTFEAAKDIDKKEQKFNEEPLFNSVRYSLIGGLDHTFSFGLILGLQGRYGFNSFVNYDPIKSDTFLDYDVHASIGVDFAKILNLF